MGSNTTGKISKEQVEKLISQSTQLPTLPHGLPYLLQILAAENLNNRSLAKIIAHFPSIATRLIFVANSAWAAPRVPIENLDLACARLGLSLVQGISIALCVTSSFDTKHCVAFDFERCWATALLVADGAAGLKSCLPKPNAVDEKTLHTAGLLHNLGLLCLAGKCPEKTSQALEMAAADDHVSTLEALRATVGTDYCEVGGVLGRAWSLPPVLVTVMEQHHNPVYAGPEFQSALLVGYAAEMVSALSHGIEYRPKTSRERHSTFNSSDLDEVYLMLTDKLDEYRELARTLFAAS